MRQPVSSHSDLRLGRVAFAAALAATLAATPALADHRGYRDGYGYDDAPGGAYDTGRSTDFAQVLSARPILRQVAVSEPRQECWDEPVRYREGAPVSGTNTAGAIVGGIIGGVIGHQFGGGSGKALATGVGAVVGASMGSHAGEYPQARPVRTGYETRCETVEGRRYEERVDGYDVTYRYNGNVYHTTMPYDPGNRIAVDVDVRPARY